MDRTGIIQNIVDRLPIHAQGPIRTQLENLSETDWDCVDTEKLARRILEVYHQTLVEPGESTGILTAQSIGERQTQMSVAYDTNVCVRIGGVVMFAPIGQLVDSVMDPLGARRVLPMELQSRLWEVPSIDTTGLVEWKRVTEVSRHPPNGPLHSFACRSGRVVACTLSHSLLTRQPHTGVVVPVKASDAVVGMPVPVSAHASAVSYLSSRSVCHDGMRIFSIPHDEQDMALVHLAVAYPHCRHVTSARGLLTWTITCTCPSAAEIPSAPERVEWEPLAVISPMPYDREYVYDFSVEENENFMCGNGVFVHNTLSSFHNCGLLNQVVTTGVPRFVELINCTKELKNIHSRVYTREPLDTLPREQVAHSLVFTTLKCVTRYAKCMHTADMCTSEYWWNVFEPDHTLPPKGLRITLDTRVLAARLLYISYICRRVTEAYPDLTARCSSVREGVLDVWVGQPENVTVPVPLQSGAAGYVNSSNYLECFYIDFLVPLLMKIHLCGIKGVTGYSIEHGSVFVQGGNLPALLTHPMFMPEKTFTNSLAEILSIFGIEATRQFLIDEFQTVLSTDGVVINNQHILLLVDAMTQTGQLRSVSRYSLRHKPSALARTSFEEVIENVLCAAVHNETDALNSVSSNVMTAKLMNAGSGYLDVLYDTSVYTQPDTDAHLESTFEICRNLLSTCNSPSECLHLDCKSPPQSLSL